MLAKPDPVVAGRWWVVQQLGQVVTFEDTGPEIRVVLDITERVLSDLNPELGMLGLAFHPEYPAKPFLYVFFTSHPESRYVVTTAYLSRFRVDPSTSAVDSASEMILMRVDSQRVMHHGGTLEFGPDGYLYVSLGDGGEREMSRDTQSLRGSLLRIDVDGGTPYSIPPDNPFVDGVNGRAEIYAWGLRNLWKFSFDRLQGDLWGGDVGETRREEMNRIVLGGNYGWPVREGSLCQPGYERRCEDPSLLPPFVEYGHDEGKAIVGGYVYRGSRVPSLWGHLLYADFGAGRVWSLDLDSRDAVPRLLHEEGQLLTSFAEDADGEVYVVRRHGAGNFLRLVEHPSGMAEDLPPTLSATGCVDVSDPVRPADHLLAYTVNVPRDSDGDDGRRWVSLPDRGRIRVDDHGDWSLPPGSVVMKHRRRGQRLVETQLLMHHPDRGWAGYSYAWNEEQDDALLLSDGHLSEIDGVGWVFSSRGECLRCHSEAAGRTLGLETGQLAGRLPDPSEDAAIDQVEHWRKERRFNDGSAPGLRTSHPLRALSDSQQYPEAVARDYLHVHCSSCHRPEGPGYGGMDLRRHVALAETGLCDVEPQTDALGRDDGLLLAPGDPERSTLLARMKHPGTERMPPVGGAAVDSVAVEAIRQWISGLHDCAAVEP